MSFTLPMLWAQWKESFSLFRWREFKPFILASLLAFIRACKFIFTYVWWVFVVLFFLIAGLACCGFHGAHQNAPFDFIPTFFSSCFRAQGIRAFLATASLIILIYVTLMALHIITVLAIRPSLEIKNKNYLIKYFPKFPAFLVLLIPFNLLQLLFPSLLFFADASNSFDAFMQSLWRGIKFMVHFLPISLFIVLAGNLLMFLLASTGGLLGIGITLLLPSLKAFAFTTTVFLFFFTSFIGFIFFAAMFSVYYTKIKHSHHQVFFEQQ